MDRETRKANLKKLQLPGTSGNKQRKTRQMLKVPTTKNAAISNYFKTPEKENKNLEELTPNIVNTTSEETCEHQQTTKVPHSPDKNTNTATRSRFKRTKLDAFIFNDPNTIPNTTKYIKKTLNDEDLVVSKEKIKKAPKSSQAKAKSSKSTRTKKQTTIKTAFLRNEQLFAEIAAQHCAADQFDGDDVQLALAISQSEAEGKGLETVEKNVKEGENNVLDIADEAELIREKLQKYGFRTAEKKDYNTFAAAFLPKTNNRRPKSKWANKFTALTLRSSDRQLKKLQENIEKLLNSQLRTKPLSENEQIPASYKLQSSVLRKSQVHEDKRILQNTENINRLNDMFFVTELFEISELPAGHLLKDWSAIQGRDLSPKRQDQKHIERLKRLEDIYQDLEEYFTSSKRLEWTVANDISEDQEVPANKETSPLIKSIEENTSNSIEKVEETEENVELNGMLELIENLQQEARNCDIDNIESNITTTSCDNKILQLLPTSKSLDMMQVSSCSYNTQATLNSTQKNRSNSPDLFADSDVEMEQIDEAEKNDKTEETVVNDKENHLEESSSDTLRTDITTYEIFSSDEVKKTSYLKINEPAEKELSAKSPIQSKVCDLIDLTQDDLELSSNNNNNNKSRDNLNQSKPIIEIDLFAESPLQDENLESTDFKCSSQQSNNMQTDKDNFKFTLSLEIHDKEQKILDKKSDETFKISQFDAHKQKEDEDIVLREIAMDQTNISFLNFEGPKQLATSFHRKTSTFDSDIIKYNLSGNDTIFQELCNKYLNHKPAEANTSTVKAQQDFDLNKSQSLTLPAIQTPTQCNNFTKFTMDLDMTDVNNGTLNRKSLLFTAKTPLKPCLNTVPQKNIYESQSFNNRSTNISIDLTQNDDENENDEVEEDDDCLVLSDDEINYSIWQANKTLNLQSPEQIKKQENNISLPNISSGDEDGKISHKENVIEFPYNKENEKDFSFLDLEEKEKSLIKINLGPEESIIDFDILASKYTTSNSADQDEAKLDRSEFGILEEYSEPIDYTPTLCTPTKALTDASFLHSPAETAAPMKRFSNCHKSSQKFQDLINNVHEKSPTRQIPEFDDFDEFDLLTSTSLLKTLDTFKKPQGIDQLLTGEISLKESQKTPETTKKLPSETQKVEHNGKIYTVRYTNSPKPDFTKYTDAELLKDLYNYGIKPLKRKQAVKMLEYIYNQTHPILMEDEENTDLAEEQQDDVITLDDFELPCTSKGVLKANKSIPKSNEKNFTLFSSDSEKEIVGDQVTTKTLNLQDSCGFEMLRYSNDLKAELQDEIYILQTNVTKKTPQPLLPFHIAWYNLVCSNRKLHEDILMYEPIDLQEIYLFLKSLGYRYDPKDLKIFFDRRCIIFRYDLANAAGGNSRIKNTNRHIRKSKKFKATNSKI